MSDQDFRFFAGFCLLIIAALHSWVAAIHFHKGNRGSGWYSLTMAMLMLASFGGLMVKKW